MVGKALHFSGVFFIGAEESLNNPPKGCGA